MFKNTFPSPYSPCSIAGIPTSASSPGLGHMSSSAFSIVLNLQSLIRNSSPCGYLKSVSNSQWILAPILNRLRSSQNHWHSSWQLSMNLQLPSPLCKTNSTPHGKTSGTLSGDLTLSISSADKLKTLVSKVIKMHVVKLLQNRANRPSSLSFVKPEFSSLCCPCQKVHNFIFSASIPPSSKRI